MRYLPQPSVRMSESCGRVLGEVAEVVAARFGAVAAADDEEVAQFAGLDRVDDLVGESEQGGVVEADRRGLDRGRLQVADLLGAAAITAEKSLVFRRVAPGTAVTRVVKKRSR